MSNTSRKVKKITDKDKNLVAFKVKKDDLERDFEGYWKNMCKALNAESLKMEDYDNDLVIAYDRNESFGY